MMTLEYILYFLIILGLIYFCKLCRKAYYKLRRLLRLAFLFVKR